MSIKGKNFVGKFTKHRTADFSRVPLFLSSGGVDALVVSRNFERRHRGAPSTVAAVVGGGPIDRIDATKTITNFWGYSTTVFDFIRRAMPWQQPRSLTDNEVYALTAFILAQNKLIGEDDSMNAETLPKVRMPNRDGFIIRFPDKI